jgi:hypothetical protein
LYRRAWWPLVAPIALPPAGAAALTYADASAFVTGWESDMAGLDLDGPDRAAGWATADPAVPEVLPAQEVLEGLDAWTYGESVRPVGQPPYGPADGGVIVAWSAQGRAIERTTLQLPEDRRALRPEEVRWVAFVSRDRLQLVGHATAQAAPPRSSKHPASFYGVERSAEIAAILAAIEPPNGG